jgi:hypothetical protein
MLSGVGGGCRVVVVGAGSAHVIGVPALLTGLKSAITSGLA